MKKKKKILYSSERLIKHYIFIINFLFLSMPLAKIKHKTNQIWYSEQIEQNTTILPSSHPF